MLGTGFIELGKGLKEKTEPSIYDWVEALKLALDRIKKRACYHKSKRKRDY